MQGANSGKFWLTQKNRVEYAPAGVAGSTSAGGFQLEDDRSAGRAVLEAGSDWLHFLHRCNIGWTRAAKKHGSGLYAEPMPNAL